MRRGGLRDGETKRRRDEEGKGLKAKVRIKDKSKKIKVLERMSDEWRDLETKRQRD